MEHLWRAQAVAIDGKSFPAAKTAFVERGLA